MVLATGVIAAAGVMMGTWAGVVAARPVAAAASKFPPHQVVCHRGLTPGGRAVVGLTQAERASVTVTRACVDGLTGGVDVTAHLGGNLPKVVGDARLLELLFAAVITRRYGAPIVIGVQPNWGRVEGRGISDRSLTGSFFAHWVGNDLIFEVWGIKLADVTAVRFVELPMGLPRSGHGAIAAGIAGLEALAGKPQASSHLTSFTVAERREVDALAADERAHPCDHFDAEQRRLQRELPRLHTWYEDDLVKLMIRLGILGKVQPTPDQVANDPVLSQDRLYAARVRAELAAVAARLPCPR